MNQESAIRRLYAAMQDCSVDGWVIVGRLELVRPRDKSSHNAVTGSHGMMDDGKGPVEVATVTAYVDRLPFVASAARTPAPKLPAKAIALVLASADGLASTGDVCVKCGGVSFQRMGTCLYCVSCGDSNGCS